MHPIVFILLYPLLHLNTSSNTLPFQLILPYPTSVSIFVRFGENTGR